MNNRGQIIQLPPPIESQKRTDTAKILRNLACKQMWSSQSLTVIAENQQELTNELTAVRAQLQQVVSRLGSIEGKKIRFSLWHNSV